MEKNLNKKLQVYSAIIIGSISALLVVLLPFLIHPSIKIIKESLPLSVIQ